MTAEKILISTGSGEVRIAELDGGALVGLTIDRIGGESLVGHIYIGRVEAVIHNLQAAFVDLGLERAGFLGLAETRPHGAGTDDAIGDYLNEGEKVLVQVTRDAQADKGPRVTLRPVLTGRDLVFTPGQQTVSISRRITDADERDRLAAVVEAAVTEAGGFIVRTAAQEAEDEDIAEEGARLLDRWAALRARADDEAPPARIHSELEAALRILRDRSGADLSGVWVDDPDLHARIKDYVETDLPDLADILHLHSGGTALFAEEGVDELIDAALDPVVRLPSGGSIQISETPALVAVDVNAGPAAGGNRERAIMEVNREAAAEIGRQIMLRNLSGLMVIDFISMRHADSQEKVKHALMAALADDPQRPFVGGFTRFGLVELTRRRKGPSLSEIHFGGPAQPVKSAMTTALEALRAVLVEAAASPAAGFTLEVGAAVADILDGAAAEALDAAEAKLGGSLEIVTDERLAADAYRVAGKGKDA